MKVLTVTNRKGGVGKSTMAVHIAAGMAKAGHRVGIVDTDSQGHAGKVMGLPDENGLFAVMVDKEPLADVIRLVPPERYSTPDDPPAGELYLLPSSDKTYKIPYEMGAEEGFLFLETLDSFGELCSLDFIVVDTNPTMSLLDGAVYLATDGFIYVTECEMLSFDGVTQAIRQMEQFNIRRRRYLGREARILGIIPNKMRASTLVHRDNIAALGEHFGSFKDGGLVMTPVVLRTIWTEASNFRELVFTFAPTGAEAEDAKRITHNILERIRTWQIADND